MPKILITNDDGIHAEGIRALEVALRDLGQVIVVAPSHEVSAASHGLLSPFSAFCSAAEDEAQVAARCREP